MYVLEFRWLRKFVSLVLSVFVSRCVFRCRTAKHIIWRCGQSPGSEISDRCIRCLAAHFTHFTGSSNSHVRSFKSWHYCNVSLLFCFCSIAFVVSLLPFLKWFFRVRAWRWYGQKQTDVSFSVCVCAWCDSRWSEPQEEPGFAYEGRL